MTCAQGSNRTTTDATEYLKNNYKAKIRFITKVLMRKNDTHLQSPYTNSTNLYIFLKIILNYIKRLISP